MFLALSVVFARIR